MSGARLPFGKNEVEWITSKQYLRYRVGRFFVRVALCWVVHFVVYFALLSLLISSTNKFNASDAHFLTYGVAIIIASGVTPLFALLFFLDEAEDIMTDRGIVRSTVGERSWKKVVQIVRQRQQVR